MENLPRGQKKDEADKLKGIFDTEFFEDHQFSSKKKVNNLSVGDIAYFQYPTDDAQHLVLVVKTSRALTGHYVARGTGNPLLTVFKLTDVSPDVLNSSMNILYKKGVVNPAKMPQKEKRRFDYFSKVKQGMTALFGKKSFRTYNKDRIVGDCWVLR